MGAKIIPFAGWEMPVWYTSVMDEHLAVRQAAGLFDVAHMGVYQAEGPDAAAFLDSVVGNDASYLAIGESCYTHFLDPDANVIDDLLIYRRGKEKFLVVVNASNDDKDWAWLNAVKDGKVLVDRARPWARALWSERDLAQSARSHSRRRYARGYCLARAQGARDICWLWAAITLHDRCAVRSLKRTQLMRCDGGRF